jgi:phosphoglycerate dehydrogenase-like enzyme
LSEDAINNREGNAPAVTYAFGPFAADKLFCAADADRLASLCRITPQPPLREFSSDAARAALRHTQILVTGWGCPMIDADVLASAPGLKLIAHAAGSVKALITPEVFDAGILVTNAADANAIPVAEFTLAAILFANKQVFRFQRDYARQRRFLAVPESFEGSAGNWQRTVGIVGASRIGRRVIDLLRPHDLDVLLYDPFVSAEEADGLGVTLTTLPDLMARSATVSLHAPLLPQTRGLIDAAMLALMADGATLINTARGGLIDGAALERELVSGRLWAVLDVTEPEALPPASPLYELDNVLLTPHIAGAIGSERERLGALIVDEIERYLAGKPLRHALTAEHLHHQA